MSLLSMFNNMEKTAQYPAMNHWERSAAANGMSVNQYMDKIAELQVARELELSRGSFNEQYALGYWDGMNKIASGNPLREGIPEIFIKIAQQARVNMVIDLIKVATGAEVAADVAEEIAKDPSWLSRMLSSAGRGISNAPKATWGGVKNFGARQLANLQRALNFGEASALSRGFRMLNSAESKLPPDSVINDFIQRAAAAPEASLAAANRSRLGAAGRLALESGLPLAGLAGTGAYLAS